ncbi:phage antirepressor [Azorhizophilus paspali]|uniref:Phage antirepressor n=1 Tax=Azorhizophilus paspali TaxID=69963 RepID=A0ABV6SGM3_AZOPA
MPQEVQLFNFEKAEVRVVSIDGEPWFVAKDVAEVLGYAKPRNAIASHCKGALIRGVLTAGGMQDMTLIPERDLYRLVMKSQLPAAERFEEWVVGEVLPSIRKTGSYGVTCHAPAIPQTLPEALRLAADLAEQNDRLQSVVAEQAPKVRTLEVLTDTAGAICITDAAKQVGIQPKALFQWLQENRWIYRRTGSTRWLAYQPRLQQGVLVHKLKVIGINDETGQQKVAEQVLVTRKGLVLLGEKLAGRVA